MSAERKNKVVVYTLILFFLIFSLWAQIRREDDFSDSERRTLQQRPSASFENILSGEFMKNFEGYTLDQFPMRDRFRTLKAVFSLYVLRQKDNNDIYLADGYVSKLEYPMKEDSLLRATQRFSYVYEKYLKDTGVKVYFSIIPDKNYYLAKQNGYPLMDYPLLYEFVRERVSFAEYIDITGQLSPDDFYKTDTHWRQEKILSVAKLLGEAMDTDVEAEYELKTLDHPFYGVYYGQSALPLPAEEIHYLTNEKLENCMVYDYQNDRQTEIYDMEKAYGKDPYEMFLSGPLPLLTIENPSAVSSKELILFRDSFGSSIAPLLAEGYTKITLVDIRYMHPDFLGKYIEFTDQDVLFLYSTLVLNNGETIK